MLKRVNELTFNESGLVCARHKKCTTCPLNFDDGKCYKDIIQAKDEYEEKIKNLTELMKRISYDDSQIISVQENKQWK